MATEGALALPTPAYPIEASGTALCQHHGEAIPGPGYPGEVSGLEGPVGCRRHCSEKAEPAWVQVDSHTGPSCPAS